jgi:hypothetical protein
MDMSYDDLPEPYGWAESYGPPENELPVAAPFSAVLARTDEVAIGLTGAQVFTNGLTFDVAVRLRRARPDDRGYVFDLMDPHGRGSAGEALLLGLEFADGSAVTNVGGSWRDASGTPGPRLVQNGGGGGGLSYDQSFWLAPLPPPGAIDVVCLWSAYDIAETHTRIDGTAIAEAAAAATVLWPLEPDDAEPGVCEPGPPDVPKGTWFARVLGLEG